MSERENGQVRPFTILIAALGGEGGGVLADLISRAAVMEGLAVQRTSIPGVAQRTGATSYYIEIYPIPLAQLNGKTPIFSLHPQPGNVDLLASTELLEAGRMLMSGFVTPDRTTLVASTHRILLFRKNPARVMGVSTAQKSTKPPRNFPNRLSYLIWMQRRKKRAASLMPYCWARWLPATNCRSRPKA